MLYLVLILVLAALGLLVTALITAHSLWAWLSIALSLVAAASLFVDWLRRRKAETAEPAEAELADEEADAVVVDETEAGQSEAETAEAEAAEISTGDEEPAEEGTTGEAPAEPTPVAATGRADGSGDADDSDDADELAGLPAEEETDAADLLIVCELEDQVIVVDEHPRYHLAECRWLVDRDTIPIAVSEARELGFTPCARCEPDAKLAERARRKKRKVGRLSKE